MDAPGFPTGPSSIAVVILIWGLVGVVLVAALVTAARVLRRSGSLGWKVLPLVAVLGVVVPALVLALPAQAHVGTDTPDGRGECPLSSVAGSSMAGDPSSGVNQYWLPCQDASRVRVGMAVGGYALAAGAVGALALARTSPSGTRSRAKAAAPTR